MALDLALVYIILVYALNVLNLACTFFGRKWFFNMLACIWFRQFLNAPIIYLYMSKFDHVLGLASSAQECLIKEYTAKCNMIIGVNVQLIL